MISEIDETMAMRAGFEAWAIHAQDKTHYGRELMDSLRKATTSAILMIKDVPDAESMICRMTVPGVGSAYLRPDDPILITPFIDQWMRNIEKWRKETATRPTHERHQTVTRPRPKSLIDAVGASIIYMDVAPPRLVPALRWLEKRGKTSNVNDEWKPFAPREMEKAARAMDELSTAFEGTDDSMVCRTIAQRLRDELSRTSDKIKGGAPPPER